MKTYGGMEVWLHAFQTSALDEGEWSASRLGRFTRGERFPRYPLNRTLSGPQSRSGRGIEPRSSSPQLSHYTNGNINEVCMVISGKGKVKVKLSLCLTEHHTIKAYWGMEV
jgi:hypothetical protein